MPKVSIYQGEGAARTFVRNKAIQAATAKQRAGIFDNEKVGVHAASVSAIATLLAKIGEYDRNNQFEDDGSTPFHAQQMANGLEGELKTFLADTKGMKKGSADYNARVETFNQSCQKHITENLEGVSRKSGSSAHL